MFESNITGVTMASIHREELRLNRANQHRDRPD